MFNTVYLGMQLLVLHFKMEVLSHLFSKSWSFQIDNKEAMQSSEVQCVCIYTLDLVMQIFKPGMFMALFMLL